MGWEQASWVPLEGVEIGMISLGGSFGSPIGLGILVKECLTDIPCGGQCGCGT